jgi:hypothetical protein
VPERGEALIKDLLAVCDEQQAQPLELLAQSSVVKRCQDCIAHAGGGDEEVPVASLLSEKLD